MCLLALDIGDKRIGIAVSDKLHIAAYPYSIEENDDSFLSKLSKIIKEKKISEIIVGLPVNLKGEEGFQAKKVIDFSEKLKEKIKLKITLYDERFSTKESKKKLLEIKKNNKISIDKYAAAVILENYMMQNKIS